MEFRFGSNDYFRPKNNTYNVQLQNIDKNWVSLGDVTTVKYYRLPAGHYKLNVRLNNNTDKTYSQTFSISFTIDEVFYKKWWFVLLACIFILSIAGSIIQMRRRRYKREENLRRAIAHDLHNTLGGKISSISNMLHVINHLKETGEPFQTELNQLIEQTVKVHSTMSDVIWVLSRTEKINLGLVNRMQDYADKWLKTAKIKVFFEHNIGDGEKSIPFNVQHELLLVYKEMLGNLLKHTFSEEVYISFMINPDKSIEFSVRNLFSKRKVDAPSSGQGIPIMKEHIERIGGILKVTALERSFEVHIRFERPFRHWKNQ
ncbi:MAG: hypothetical protein IPH31_22970 [Lewinellaceae bacterium]|nr:hypothetical protein [Lewinellaceae bacterium]